MTVPDDEILKTIDWMLRSSEPGDALHHLYLAHLDRDPLGRSCLVHAMVAAIAAEKAEGLESPDTFIPKAIVTTIKQTTTDHGPLYLVVLALEVFRGDVEATQVYAAVADGRRWYGAHYLTGPRAGQVDGPHALPSGAPLAEAERVMPHARLVRQAVRLTTL